MLSLRVSVEFYAYNRDHLRAAAAQATCAAAGRHRAARPAFASGHRLTGSRPYRPRCRRASQRHHPHPRRSALPFGCSQHHLPFGGTLSFSTETYYRLLSELVESLLICGARRGFLMNGHGGNHELAQLVARDLALKYPASLAASSYWTIAWEALLAAGATQDGRLAGHAGTFETSLLLALRSELITEPRPHRDTIVPTDVRGANASYRAEHHASWARIDGYTDSPDCAIAEHGRCYLDVIVLAVAQAFIRFHRGATALHWRE